MILFVLVQGGAHCTLHTASTAGDRAHDSIAYGDLGQALLHLQSIAIVVTYFEMLQMEMGWMTSRREGDSGASRPLCLSCIARGETRRATRGLSETRRTRRVRRLALSQAENLGLMRAGAAAEPVSIHALIRCPYIYMKQRPTLSSSFIIIRSPASDCDRHTDPASSGPTPAR